MAKKPDWVTKGREGHIVGVSPPGLTRRHARNLAEREARGGVVKARTKGKGGSANISGLRTSEYYTNPKTGQTHALVDTTEMRYDPKKKKKKAQHEKIKGN